MLPSLTECWRFYRTIISIPNLVKCQKFLIAIVDADGNSEGSVQFGERSKRTVYAV
jgi:hypothetical protein